MSAPARGAGGRRRDDRGQTVVLVIGLVAIAAALITVVVDASRVFLTHRALTAAADAAAAAGASGLAEGAVYEEGPEPAFLPLGDGEVLARVRTYVADAGLTERYRHVEVREVSTDGVSVRVRLAARVPVPFGALVGAGSGVPVDADATARAPMR